MIRKAFSLFICVLLIQWLSVSVSASDFFINQEIIWVVDQANLLESTEETALNMAAAELSTEYKMDIAVLTLENLNGKTAQDYADNYYDANYSENGILFLLAMDEREWYITTYGNGVYALTDYGIQAVGEIVVGYFSDGYYYDGFCTYLDEVEDYLRAYANGTPIDGYADYSGDYYHGDREEVVYYEADVPQGTIFLIALGIGLVSAAVIVVIMRAAMNTKRPQRSAEVYLKSGSFHLYNHKDIFLYSNIKKVRRQQNNNSSGRGGGSSVHRSSSGRRHGGGGGKF